MTRLSADTRHPVQVELNGTARSGFAEPRTLLSDFLRHELGATGTHVGCEHGVCGACTVLVDGRPVRSCLTLAVRELVSKFPLQLVCAATAFHNYARPRPLPLRQAVRRLPLNRRRLIPQRLNAAQEPAIRQGARIPDTHPQSIQSWPQNCSCHT